MLHPDLARLVDSVRFLDDSRVVIGEETHVIAENAAPGPESVAALAALLYRRLYLGWTAATPSVSDALAVRAFQAGLTRANPGRGHWEAGWRVAHRGRDGSWVVRSPQGLLFRAADGSVRANDDSDGATCRVRLPPEYRRLATGFYLFAGDTDAHQPAPGTVTTRVYWHLTAAAAARFVAAVAGALNGAAIPFHAKVLDDPHAYRRPDAGVVYLARDDLAAAREPLQRCHRALARGMRDSVPLLTLRLAPGLALAEDPGDGQSFGQHRCALVAAALTEAQRQPCQGPDVRHRAVLTAFRDAGLDPLAPHLSGHSPDGSYPGAWSAGRAAGVVVDEGSASAAHRRAGGTGAILLDAATAIGESLCASAVWGHGRRSCTWVGRTNPVAALDGSAFQPQVSSLGPDLYGGLGGVACFLAELFARTGNPAFRETAVGALRWAVHQTVGTTPDAPAAGLFTGSPGVAFAGLAVSRVAGQELPDELRSSVLRDLQAVGEDTPDDLVGGRAGAVIACLALAGTPGGERALAVAESLGEQLCRSGIGSGAARVLPRRAEPDVPLTGLAHGAAGIGVALLSLYALTRRPAVLAASRQAFAYEDALLDSSAGNWPDLRPGDGPHGGSGARRFMVAWCHGAPGIALCRVRAGELDPERREHHLHQARIALDTTLRHLQNRPSPDLADATCCHGLAGLVEALLVGHRALGDSRYAEAAAGAAEELATTILDGRPTVSGTICGGPNPSLMLGTAGVGYELLRVSDPDATPPVLLPRVP